MDFSQNCLVYKKKSSKIYRIIEGLIAKEKDFYENTLDCKKIFPKSIRTNKR
jgi:hypothetical protein